MTTTIDKYDIGDSPTITGTFTDGPTAVDPDTVTCQVRDPDGTVTTPTPTKRSVGVYDVVVAIDKAGTWNYRFVGAGTWNAAEEDYFWVRDQETA